MLGAIAVTGRKIGKYINIMKPFESHFFNIGKVSVIKLNRSFGTDMEGLTAAPQNFILGIITVVCYNKVTLVPV